MTSRFQIEALAGLIEEAYDGDPEHSLLANLRNLEDDHWTEHPPAGGRTVAGILEHVAWCKWMYEDYAFGEAAMKGDSPPLVPPGGARFRPVDELLDWLAEGHERWLSSVRALGDDSELDADRLTNWGERMATRAIIHTMIAHDYYHAGEINHIRALLSGTDRWNYWGEG